MNDDDWTLDLDKVTDLKYKVVRDGYIWNDLYDMAEHRVVAMRLLGRQLTDREHVHHCDGDKQYNEPENLFVVSPAVHDWIHILSRPIFLRDRKYTCGVALTRPSTLSEFLKSESVPHIWLKEVQDGRGG